MILKRKIVTNKIKKDVNPKGIRVYILCGICCLTLIASIYLTIESSTNGVEFAKLQKTEAQLLAHQEELQQTLVESLSVNTLQEQSSELGFSKVGNLVYIVNSGSVADSDAVAKLP
jgi:hypothetical protein